MFKVPVSKNIGPEIFQKFKKKFCFSDSGSKSKGWRQSFTKTNTFCAFSNENGLFKILNLFFFNFLGNEC